MTPKLLLSLTAALCLTGCAHQGPYEPSEFAENYDPGKVIESVVGIMQENPERMARNKSVWMQATHAKHSYFKIFKYEPRTTTNDLTGFVTGLRVSAEKELQREGFGLDFQTNQPSDISISYRSDQRSGTVHLLTTERCDGSFHVTGVIHEYPSGG